MMLVQKNIHIWTLTDATAGTTYRYHGIIFCGWHGYDGCLGAAERCTQALTRELVSMTVHFGAADCAYLVELLSNHLESATVFNLCTDVVFAVV